ncbi:hypothetical protein SB02110_00467 [Klebsiella quasipneumoniae subsp. quasipneumoniae]|nr:hypothetical protein SB02110_00467 [Klebsiella quasipneumoniae subsp. quasipneumoniae]
MLPQPLTGRTDGVGVVLKTNPLLQGTTRPLKFLRAVNFFTAVSQKETRSYGKTTQTARLP